MIYVILRPLAMLFYKIFYRVKIVNKQNLVKKGRRMVICNHLGKADVMVVGALYPNKTYFLSKKEWFDNKFLGALMGSMGAIPLDREKPDLSTIKTSLKILKEDKRLAIFPEGARNFTGNNLQEFKQGVALFAVKGKSPITPVIIYDHLKMFKRNYVIVGESFEFEEYYNVKFTDEISKECTLIVKTKMEELQQELFKYVESKNKKVKKID